MADSTVKTIPELPETSALTNTDLLAVDDGARTYKIQWSSLKALLGTLSAVSADANGKITFTLANGTTLEVTPHDSSKQDVLTFDDTPTQNSSNPVKSGGVYTSLGLKLNSADYVNFTGATDQAAGTSGKVPAPAAGGARYLGSEGAWLTPASSPASGSSLLISAGAVHTALGDKYEKPAGGIPDSDIASAATWNGAVTDVAKMEVLVVDLGTVSSLPKTATVTGIETDMVCVKAELGTPGAQQSDWTVNTDTAGQITLSGTISGSTTVKLYLMKSR